MEIKETGKNWCRENSELIASRRFGLERVPNTPAVATYIKALKEKYGEAWTGWAPSSSNAILYSSGMKLFLANSMTRTVRSTGSSNNWVSNLLLDNLTLSPGLAFSPYSISLSVTPGDSYYALAIATYDMSDGGWLTTYGITTTFGYPSVVSGVGVSSVNDIRTVSSGVPGALVSSFSAGATFEIQIREFVRGTVIVQLGNTILTIPDVPGFSTTIKRSLLFFCRDNNVAHTFTLQ